MMYSYNHNPYTIPTMIPNFQALPMGGLPSAASVMPAVLEGSGPAKEEQQRGDNGTNCAPDAPSSSGFQEKKRGARNTVSNKVVGALVLVFVILVIGMIIYHTADGIKTLGPAGWALEKLVGKKSEPEEEKDGEEEEEEEVKPPPKKTTKALSGVPNRRRKPRGPWNPYPPLVSNSGPYFQGRGPPYYGNSGGRPAFPNGPPRPMRFSGAPGATGPPRPPPPRSPPPPRGMQQSFYPPGPGLYGQVRPRGPPFRQTRPPERMYGQAGGDTPAKKRLDPRRVLMPDPVPKPIPSVPEPESPLLPEKPEEDHTHVPTVRPPHANVPQDAPKWIHPLQLARLCVHKEQEVKESSKSLRRKRKREERDLDDLGRREQGQGENKRAAESYDVTNDLDYENISRYEVYADGDCLFHCVRRVFADIGIDTTVGMLRRMVARNVGEREFQFLESLYLDATKRGEKSVLEDYGFMKNVRNLTDLKQTIMLPIYFGDEMALSALERAYPVKFLVLCVRPNNRIELARRFTEDEELLANAPHFGLLLLNQFAKHYELLRYKDKNAMKFSELPPKLQRLVNQQDGERTKSADANRGTNVRALNDRSKSVAATLPVDTRATNPVDRMRRLTVADLEGRSRSDT